MTLDRKFKRDAALRAGFVAAMLLLHCLSTAYMAEARHVEIIMAGGPKQTLAFIMVILFIGIRIGTVLILPGFILSWLVRDGYTLWKSFSRAQAREKDLY